MLRIIRAFGVLVLGLAMSSGVPALEVALHGLSPVTIKGVTYRVRQESTGEGDKAVVRTTLEAIDPQTGRLSWSLSVGDISPSSDGKSPTASVGPIHDGLLVASNQSLFYVNPAARTFEPLLDRRSGPNECEVHHKPLLDDLIRIQYGLIRGSYDNIQDQKANFPHASTTVLGGCVIREAKRGAVRYCPECREVEKTWTARVRGEAK